MIEQNELSPPDRSRGDLGLTVLRAILQLVPGGGGAAAELMQWIIVPPIEQRRDKWMQSVADELRRLSSGEAFFEALRSNEAFVSAFQQASQVAMRTHKAEKLTALRNAVANVAVGTSIDESEQQIFLQFVDIFTEWHIRLLRFVDARIDVGNIRNGALAHQIEQHFPPLRDRGDFYRLVWRDLFQRALVDLENLQTMMSSDGLVGRKSTDFGRKFLSFIGEPRIKA